MITCSQLETRRVVGGVGPDYPPFKEILRERCNLDTQEVVTGYFRLSWMEPDAYLYGAAVVERLA